MNDFPTEIYWVTGLRQKGWLFAETRYLKLALNRRVKYGGAPYVKVWKFNSAGGWLDVTHYFLDENGRKKW